MNIILKQLIPTAKTGMMIPGPDRKIHRCFLILISYSVDYPEACMICQIKKGLYVQCNVSKDSLHDLTAVWSLRQSDDSSVLDSDDTNIMKKK
jgi:hypothetical protein